MTPRRILYSLVTLVAIAAAFLLLRPDQPDQPIAPAAVVSTIPAPASGAAASSPMAFPASGSAGSPVTTPPPDPTVPEAVYLPTYPGQTPTPNQRLVLGSEEVSRKEPVQNADGSYTRVRMIRTTEFKYPLLRVVETFQPKPDGKLDPRPKISLMVADHVLIQPVHSLSDAEAKALATEVGGSVRQRMRTSSNILIDFEAPDPDALLRAVAALKQHPLVKTAEPDHIVQALAVTPNDPSYGQLYGLHNTGQAIQGVVGTVDADMDVPEAWDFTTGSRNVLVAVVDTGVDPLHPDLVDQIATNPGEIPDNGLDDDNNGFVDDVRGWDFVSGDNDPTDENNHGTHCAGTIGGTGNDGKGIVGVNWKVSIVASRFLSAGGSGTDSDSIEAVNYSVLRGARISSNSWGSSDYSAAAKVAFDAATTAGQLLVCAAGNDGTSNAHYPSSYDSAGILSVAATDNKDNLASFSTYGTTVDVAGPGVNVYSSIVKAPYYAYFSGTSMATPHVAGVGALLLAVKPSLTNVQVIEAIKNSVDVKASLNGKVTTSGRVNAYKAIRQNLITPWLNVVATTYTDNGDANSIPNPGETVTINSTFRNVAQNAANGVVATLSLASADPYVSITTATANLGGLVSLQEKIGTFAVTIAPNTPTPHTVELTVTTVDSANPPNTQTFPSSFIVYTQSPVTGTVRAVDGTPIAGATVSYAGVYKGSTQTAADGTYSLSLVDGSPEISVTKTAYAPSEKRVVTLPPGKSGIDFVLGKAELAIGANALTATVRADSRVVLDLPLSNSGTIPSAFKVAEMQYGYDKQTIGVSGYTWYDITATGTKVDNKVLGYNEYSNFNSGPYAIGMDFPFYENKFRSFRIHNNGWMSFTNSSRSVFNFMTDLPNPERPENLIAFAWAFNFDWSYKDAIAAAKFPANARSMYYQQVDPQTFVITQKQWSLLEWDMLTSQVVLKRDGTILLQYGKYEATSYSNYVTAFPGPVTYCGGIQDGQSRRGLTAVYGMGNGVVDPVEGAVARIRPVIGAPWLSTDVGAGSVSPNGGTGSLKVTLDATGLAAGTYTTSLVLESNATGQPKISIPVTFTVTATDPGLQWVAPAIGTTLTPGGSTTLDVQVLGSVASVTGVQFYNGSTLLGAGVFTGGTHYTFNWTGIPAGAYDLSAVATLSDGRTVWTPVQPANVGTGFRVSIDALDYSTETPATSRNRAIVETYGRPRLDFNTLTLTPYARTATITRTGTTAKVTMPAGHLLQKFAFYTAAPPKDTVKISGATETQYNGLKSVTMVSYASDNSTTSDDYTFTVAVSGSNPITPATGNIDAEDTGSAVILNGGTTIGLGGEISRKIAYPYTITDKTVLEFDFLGNAAAGSGFPDSVIGIGFDNDNVLSKTRVFQIWGGKTDWTSIQTYRTYQENTFDFTKSRWRHYRIPVGKHYTGAMNYLTFIQTTAAWYYRNDIDAAYRNVTVYEEPSKASAESNYTFTWSFNDSADTPQGEEIFRTYFEPESKTINVNAFLAAKTASASRTVEITGGGAFGGRIKFQPASTPVFTGQIPDNGLAYSDRGNGYTYGWSTGGNPAANNSAIYSLASYNQLKCSFIGQSATQTWEVAVPNGLYQVYLYAGSATRKSSNHIKVEGQALIDKQSATNDFIDTSKKVLVTDGKLTLTNVPTDPIYGDGALSYIDFSQLSGAAPHPYAAFTATQLTALPPFVVGFDGSASFSNSSSIVSYDWDFGDGTTGTGQLASHNYATPGLRTVTLTITDNAGETGTFSTAIRATDWTPIQAWRVSKFNTPYNTGDAANNADPNKNGILNLMEYALGRNPILADFSPMQTLGWEDVGGNRYLKLSVTRNPAATDVTFTIEVGDALSIWESGPGHTTILTNTPSLLEARDNVPSSDADGRFIRLRVTQP